MGRWAEAIVHEDLPVAVVHASSVVQAVGVIVGIPRLIVRGFPRVVVPGIVTLT